MPEKIENIYIKSQFVEQVFVHGESLKVKTLLIFHSDGNEVRNEFVYRAVSSLLLCQMLKC